jgi:malate permease and related proteins
MLIQLLFFLVLGYILKKIWNLSAKLTPFLMNVIVYLAMPAVILLRVPDLEINRDVMIPVGSAWFCLVIGALLSYYCYKKWNFTKETLACMLLVCCLGNTSFYGFPIIKAYLHEDLIKYAVLYDQLGSFLALSTYGTFVIALFSNREKKVSVLFILKKVFSFPPFIALMISLFLLRGVDYPIVIRSFFEYASLLLIPAAMLTVGLALNFRLEKETRRLFYLGTLIKMIIAPLLLFACFKMLKMNSEAVMTSIFEAAMPPQITASIFAMRANFNPPLAAAMVSMGIIFSFFSLYVFKWLLTLL